MSGSWSVSGIIAFPSYQVLCQGGGGTGAIPLLSNTGVPEVNSSFSVTLSQARANTMAVLFTGLSDTMWAGGTLPFSFAGIGAPGCNMLAEPIVDLPAMVDAGGNASISIPVPNNTALIGSIAYQQWFVVDPPANALGTVLSNAAKVTVGG